MSAPTAAEIFKQVPKSLLDSQVSDLHLEELATKIVTWEDYATTFGLSEAEQEEIRRDERRYRSQKRAALRLWKEKKGRHATYRQLIAVFCSLRKNELTDSVKRLLLPTPKGQKASVSILDAFRSYLVDCYAQTPHPSQKRWPFSRTTAYVDLPLFEAPLTEREPGSQEELPPLKLVELGTILAGSHKAKRKVVLLEGVAGSGKTTLTWHACQKWAEGLILQQFPLLIHVSLADPAIRSATCLADIIPHPSGEMREAVAKAIAEQHGKKVCFLLDGWDEAHPDLQPFVRSFLDGSSGRSMLPCCSIVVTSRPVGSGPLYPLLTSRVVVGKLDRAGVDDLLNACLTPEETEDLLKVLNQNSQLASLCNLPINTAIVVHLVQYGQHSLPETRTGLFKALVCNLLIRHVQLRTSHGLLEVKEFENLPQDILKELIAISSLAYHGIMQHSRVFDASTLRRAGLATSFDTLGLMEVRQQLTSFGPSSNYSFLHYSVQEFLAAWHMSRLGSEEQAKTVSDVLHSSPLSPVLPFFAGLTGLSSPAVRDILLEVTKHPLDHLRIMSNKPHTEPEDRRRLALALLNCIYETQDRALCQLVKPPFNPLYTPEAYAECDLSFPYLGLDPGDCLSIGYFMAHRGNCKVCLRNCFLSESGIESLLNQLMKTPASSRSSARVSLNLSENLLTSKSMKLVRKALVELSQLSQLVLNGPWPSSQVTTNLVYLIEGLCRRSDSSCILVYIAECGITSEHIHLLVLLLTTCRCISTLGLSANKIDIGGAMPLITKALEQNTTLKELLLDESNVGDTSLTELGKVFQMHSSIRLVWLRWNIFSPTAMIAFLKLQFRSRLKQVEISRPLNDEENHIYRQLLQFRAMNSMPPLLIDRECVAVEKAFDTSRKNLYSLPRRVQSRDQD